MNNIQSRPGLYTHIISRPFNNAYANPRASALFSQALLPKEQVDSKDPSLPNLNKGNADQQMGNYKEALKHFTAALDQSEPSWLAHRGLGRCLLALGQYDKALEHYQNALKDIGGKFGKGHIKSAAVYRDIAEFYETLGKHHLALDQLSLAQSVINASKTINHKELAKTLLSTGRTLLSQKKSNEATAIFREACNLCKKHLNKNDPHLAMAYAGFAESAVLQKNYDLAVIRFERAQEVYESTLGKVHPCIAHVLGSIGDTLIAKGAYQEAIKKLQSAHSNISQLQHNSAHPMLAAINYSVAKAYRMLGKYEEALTSRRKALKALSTLPKQNAFRTRVKQKIAQDLVQLALHDPKKTTECLKEALAILESLVEQDINIIQAKQSNLQLYDLIGHNTLLDQLARCYKLIGAHKKAGDLYLSRAKSIEKHFPTLAIIYLEKAYKTYKTLPSEQKSCFQVLVLKGKILKGQNRLFEAERCFLRALRYQRSPLIKKLLNNIHVQLRATQGSIDDDLWAQINRATVTHNKLQALYLADLEESGKLSDQTKNRTVDLIIKFRNILDQAFGRFCRESIYTPNQSDKITSHFFFPVKTSKIALENLFSNTDLYSSQATITESSFKIATPKNLYILAYQHLKRLGYLDGQDRLTSRFDPDNPASLTGFPIEFDPYVGMLHTVLRRQPKNQIIKPSVIADKGKGLCRPLVSPHPKTIITALIKNNCLKPDLNQHGKWILTKSADDITIDGNLAPFKSQIIAGLKRISLQDFPKAEAALFQNQPFFYYNELRPELLQHSWLEKITHIGNDAKHVRLTPQHIQDDLAEKIGTIERKQTTIVIEYVEQGIYTWSFIPALNNVPHKNRVARSREVFKTLTKVGIIKAARGHHQISDPDIKKLVKSYDAVSKNAFEKKICKLLPSIPRADALAIAHLLIRKVEQQTFTKRNPDLMIDLDTLLQNSLQGVIRVVTALTAHQKQNRLPVLPISLPPLIVPKSTEQMKKEAQSIAAKIFSADITKLKGLQTLHNMLKSATFFHYSTHNPEKSGELFGRVAQFVAKTHPWLAATYHQKAIDCLLQTQTNGKKALREASQLSRLYKQYGIGYKGSRTLEQALTYFHNQTYAEELRQSKKQLLLRSSSVDNDSASQLRDLHSRIFRIKYACFKATIDPKNRPRVLDVQNEIVETMIKIHHLLDQGLMRFFNKHILKANQMPYSQSSFPCVGSNKIFESRLRVDGVLKTQGASLRNFPHIFKALKEIQPFATQSRGKASWWEKIHTLSLEAKHVRIHIPEPNRLKVNDQTGSIESFYPMPYSSNTLFEWDFADILGPQRSVIATKRLKAVNYLNKKGRVVLTSTQLTLFRKYVEAKKNNDPTQLIRKHEEKLIIKLKSTLSKIKPTDSELKRILERLCYYGRRSMGDKTLRPQKIIPVLEVLDHAVDQTAEFIQIFSRPS